jgi:hypothetical protein
VVGFEYKKWKVERHVLKSDWTMYSFTILDALVNIKFYFILGGLILPFIEKEDLHFDEE